MNPLNYDIWHKAYMQVYRIQVVLPSGGRELLSAHELEPCYRAVQSTSFMVNSIHHSILDGVFEELHRIQMTLN